MTVLVLAEVSGDRLTPGTLRTIRAAQGLADRIDLLVVGPVTEALLALAASVDGVSTLQVADHPAGPHAPVEWVAEAMLAAFDGHEHVLAEASVFGKSVLPRVAARLDVSQLSEVIGVLGPEVFVRPVHAGSALATVRCLDAIKVLTIRAAAFEPASLGSGRAPRHPVAVPAPARCSVVLERSVASDGRPDLGTARVVVAGGRGLGSAGAFTSMLEPLADQLGAAVGASRAAVDSGFAGNELQVGQTGKIVAPQVYLAIGISGAIQHLAGMKDSRHIFAVNQDPDAPIHAVADFSLVEDLHVALPALTDAL